MLGESLAIVEAFLAAEWSNDERHQRRIDIMSEFQKTGVTRRWPRLDRPCPKGTPCTGWPGLNQRRFAEFEA
jgi:hypothetical protein